jgi:hypothetical protein
MNAANTTENRKTAKKLAIYGSMVIGGVLGVLGAYKLFEYIFTIAIGLISPI